MIKIKKLRIDDFDRFVNIVINAYPGFKIDNSEKALKLRAKLINIQKNDPVVNFYGAFDGRELVGGMRLHNLEMNLYGNMVKVGGVGLVAVDLAHKKEKVCFHMIKEFHDRSLKSGACMAALYPFRPDFYRKMGYGYGSKMNRYKFNPAELPFHNKSNIVPLTVANRNAMKECYERYAEKHHGMMRLTDFDKERWFRENVRIVGVKKGRKLEGFMTFAFHEAHKTNFLLNDLNVSFMIYDSRDAYLRLISYLKTQADQVRRVFITTEDNTLPFLPRDARDDSEELVAPVYHQTNTAGIGLMYRINNIPEFLDNLHGKIFGLQDITIKFNIKDSFLEKNGGSCIIKIEDGKASLKKRARVDCTVEMDISDFSSLMMGAVDFEKLYMYGLVEIDNDKYLDAINDLFKLLPNPVCTTLF